MKILALFLLLSLSLPASAIGVSCGDKMETYRLGEKAKFDICPMKNGSLSIYANSIGGNYHTCNFEGIAQKKENIYVASDGECKITFEIEGANLVPTFGAKCKSFCGARAGWRNGTYAK